VTATQGFFLQINCSAVFLIVKFSSVFSFLILSLYYSVALGNDFCDLNVLSF
jgi:hypothetical protein